MPDRITPTRTQQPTDTDERQRIVEVLTRHYANNQLTESELETRLQQVYEATTRRELDTLIADLPPVPGEAATAPGPHISKLLSGHETKLAGVVPSGLRVRVQLGYIELDLTEATFEPGVTDIEVQAFMGYVQIRFPRAVRVENHGHALFGFFSFRNKRGRRAQAATGAEPIVRVTGRVTFGFAEGR